MTSNLGQALLDVAQLELFLIVDVADLISGWNPLGVVIPCLDTLGWCTVEKLLIDLGVNTSSLIPSMVELVVQRILRRISLD